MVGGQSPRKVRQGWDSIAGEGTILSCKTTNKPNRQDVGHYSASSSEDTCGTDEACAWRSRPPLHSQEEVLREPLPETPLSSCVILRKPQTLGFPDCQVDNNLSPASFGL